MTGLDWQAPVLLYRREDGVAVALENRCPHRVAPLSMGCLQGNAVQCGYHGFRFGHDGTCVHVPSIKAPLPAANVRSCALREPPPYVWIWPGDPLRMTAASTPSLLDWTSDATFARIHGRMDPPRFTSDADSTAHRQEFRGSPLPPVFAEPLGVAPGTPYDRDNYGAFVTPALQVAAVDLKDPVTGSVTGRFRVAHATTPVDMHHMHYFWTAGRDFGTSVEQMSALDQLTQRDFAEDEAMIEAIDALQRRDPRGASWRAG